MVGILIDAVHPASEHPPPYIHLLPRTQVDWLLAALWLIAARVSTYMSALNQFTISGSGVSLSGEISVPRLIINGVVKAIPISDKMMGIRNTEIQVLAGRTRPKAVQSFLDYLTVQLQPNL